MPKTIEEYLKEPYSRILIPEEDGGFSAKILEFDGCYAIGETVEEAYRNLENTARSWIGVCLDHGLDIPPPATLFLHEGILKGGVSDKMRPEKEKSITNVDDVWKCTECGESNSLDPRWRWNGFSWEHHHDYPVGYVAAKSFGSKIKTETDIANGCAVYNPKSKEILLNTVASSEVGSIHQMTLLGDESDWERFQAKGFRVIPVMISYEKP